MKQVRVAIADDSAFIRKALVRILEADPRLTVVGTASCGEELLDELVEWAPDVISLDLSMPGIGGLRTLDKIMELAPTPVIILSTHARQDAPLTIEALHRGAVDFIDKQRFSLVDFRSLSRILIEKILEIAGRPGGAAVERPAPVGSPAKSEASALPKTPEFTKVDSAQTETAAPGGRSRHDLLIVAASTGGPMAIQTVLEGLAPRPPVPVVLVQHMPPDFTNAFAERLNNHLPFAVRHVCDREPLLSGTAYVAPGGYQLCFKKTDRGLAAALTEDPVGGRHSPSADVTFQSAAEAAGARVLAAVLTGMGRDGALGLLELARRGAHGIAQDRDSSVVFGMPKAAIELGGARDVLPLAEIGPRLAELLSVDTAATAALS